MFPWRRTRTAIAWLTHFYDSEGQAAFSRLAAEAAPWGTVFQVRDGFGARPGERVHRLIALTDAEIAAASPARFAQRRVASRAGSRAGGYVDLVHSAILARLRSFDYVWVIEYDVDFTGNWGALFSELSRSRADLLGTTFYPESLSKGWKHWTSFVGPPDLKPIDKMRGFFPVVRLSQRFGRGYHKEVQRNWGGHFEALWPTIARYRGLRIEDIGGKGPLVPLERHARIYTNGDPSLRAGTAGTFRFRPPAATRYWPESDAEAPPNHLIHPVKTAAFNAQAHMLRPRDVAERRSPQATIRGPL